MECFTNLWDLCHMSIWKGAHRKHFERGGPSEYENKKRKSLDVFWTNFLFVAFNTDQSDFFTASW